MTQPNNTQLHQFLVAHFNLEELKTLCFNLGIDYDDLSGNGKSDKARELVLYTRRHGRKDHLFAQLSLLRPAAWKAVFATIPSAGTPRQGASTPPITRDPRQIFISHATADAKFAHMLATDLRAKGWRVWIAPDSIRPGEKWVEAIDRGLETSGVFVVVLTPDAVASRWVNTETDAAVSMEHESLVEFIPLERADCKPKRLWRQYQYLPFRGSYEVGLDMLLRRLDGEQHNEISIQSIANSVKVASDEALVESELAEFEGIGTIYALRLANAGIYTYEDLANMSVDYLRKVVNSPEVANPLEWIMKARIALLGIELIRIPSGPFLYGSWDADTMARKNEKPKRKIVLPEYWIGRYPVTNAQYKRFVDATNHRAPSHWIGTIPPQEKLDHPVIHVSWNDTKAFCDWAGLALPSEEQWEKAARGTDGRTWPWGNEYPTNRHCNFGRNVDDTTPIGKYSPQGDSFYGCADMAGNVWEWTNSWFDKIPSFTKRVERGGSYQAGKYSVTVTARSGDSPDNVDMNFKVGFRVVDLLSNPEF